MLTIKNLCFTYPNSNYEVLNDINLTFNDTGLYLLSGNSGCGKTTLLNLLSANLPLQDGNIVFDAYQYQEQTQEKNQAFVRENIAYINQGFSMMQGTRIYDCIRIIQPAITDEDIQKYLVFFKLDTLSPKVKVKSLSSGEKQRLAILIALLNDKKIILCDEVTANLDEKNKYLVLNILKQLSLDHLVICVSHELELYHEFVDFHYVYKENTIKPLPFERNPTFEGEGLIPLSKKKKPTNLFILLYRSYIKRYLLTSLILFVFLLGSFYFTNFIFKNYSDEFFCYDSQNRINNVLVTNEENIEHNFSSSSYLTHAIDANSLDGNGNTSTIYMKSDMRVKLSITETYDFFHESIYMGEYKDNDNYVYIGINTDLYSDYDLRRINKFYNQTILYGENEEKEEFYVNGIYHNEGLGKEEALLSFNSTIKFSISKLLNASYKLGKYTRQFKDNNWDQLSFLPIEKQEDLNSFYVKAYNNYHKIDLQKHPEFYYNQEQNRLEIQDKDLESFLNNLPLSAFYYNNNETMITDLNNSSVNCYSLTYGIDLYEFKILNLKNIGFIFILGVYIILDFILFILFSFIKKHSTQYQIDMQLLKQNKDKKLLSHTRKSIALFNIILATVIMIPFFFIIGRGFLFDQVLLTSSILVINYIFMIVLLNVGDKNALC